MQKLRRVEIKEGEIRLVRHFKYEGTVVAAGGGRMRLVGPSGFDGGLRLPVVLTSPPSSSPLPPPPFSPPPPLPPRASANPAPTRSRVVVERARERREEVSSR